MADKELKIGIAIEATGDGAQKSREEIEGVSTATDELKGKLDEVSQADPQVAVDTSEVEEAKEKADELTQAVETVGEIEAAPVVDATSVEEAKERTDEIAEALDGLAEKETVIQVDSDQLDEAADSAREAGDEIEEVASQAGESVTTEVNNIVGTLSDAPAAIKTVTKLMKGLGGEAAAAAGKVSKLGIVVRLLNVAFKANPILTVVSALGALVTVLTYFKTRAEEAANAQQAITKTAEEAAAEELELAKQAGYAAEAHDKLKTSTDGSNTAIATQNARLAESKRLMDLDINAIERKTEAQARMTDAMTANQILDVDLLEANGGISKEDADTQRAAIRRAAEDAKFAGDQNAKRAVLEKLKSEQDDIVNQIRAKRDELAAMEQNLNTGGPTAEGIAALEKAKAEMEAAQKALEAARDRGPQLALGGMSGQIADAQKAVEANIALEEAKKRVEAAQARINVETADGNAVLQEQFKAQQESLADLQKHEQQINDRYNNRVPALQEQIELDKTLKEQADERAAKEAEIAEIKERQTQSTKDQADEAARLKNNSPSKPDSTPTAPSAAGSTSTPGTSTTTTTPETPLERVTPEGRINARPTHVRGTVTGAIDQPIGINQPAQGGTNFAEALRQRGNPLGSTAPSSPGATAGGQAGGSGASGAKEAADAAKKLAEELAGLKEIAAVLKTAATEAGATRGDLKEMANTFVSNQKQMRADIAAIKRSLA